MLFLLLISGISAKVEDDLNCTTYTAADGWRYSETAGNCANTISDAACTALFPPKVAGDLPPSAGKDMNRPLKCYTTTENAPRPIDDNLKAAAIANCPKNCGYCCQTEAFKCSNVQFPRLNCATITTSQCSSTTWRAIIAQDCPSSCGFCNLGGCVDAVTNCANDISICTTVGMQDFVNQYCQRTCSRCASSTSSAASSSSCTSYISDSSTACAGWAANGFCTNSFYTVAQRRAYCATTCRLC